MKSYYSTRQATLRNLAAKLRTITTLSHDDSYIQQAADELDEFAKLIEQDMVADAARYRFALVTPDYAICVWDVDDDGYESYYAINQVQIDAAMEKRND